MKTRLIAVGKVRESYVAAAVADFTQRLARVAPVEMLEVAASDAADPDRAMADEGERILRALDPADHVWLLDREGRAFSSVALSRRLTLLADSGTRRIVFVVAGTFGASPAVVARANARWSLSELTFLHEWARAIVLEQLYRAAKIARNEPYHH